MLKRNPSLTNQAKALIKQRILDDEFEDGRIPSETDLANKLGVSRTTIRDALSRLENEGVVTRKQGSGTFINRAGLQIQIRLEEIWSYEAVLEAHGYTPTTRILDVRETAAPPDIAAALALATGDPILSVDKLFLQDGEPVILTHNHIPARLAQRPLQADQFHRPIYHFLAEHCGQQLSHYLSEIVPKTADDALAQSLNVPVGTPLISFDEVGYSHEGEPILKAQSYFRDDLIRLRLIRRQL